MKTASTVARVLFGLAFTAAGAIGIYLALRGGPPPVPQYPLADQFQSIGYRSHFTIFVNLVQLIVGLLLLFNRYVPLALMAGAAVLANILVYHITMMPIGIFPGLVLTICWILVALEHKPTLLPLLRARPSNEPASPRVRLV
jgi:putative oxidoreductase